MTTPSPSASSFPRLTAVAPPTRNLRRNRLSFSVAALADDSDGEYEEDATPSDGEVVSTASRLLPPPGRPLAGALPPASSSSLSSSPSLSSSSSLFSELKVLVVGATGRTGRQVVARLVAEGVPCRCLVRSASRARALLPDASAGVTLVRGDLTQPSSLPLALADCNAVIWAAGVPSLVAMFKDPLAPLRVEAEGVANLVAAVERSWTRGDGSCSEMEKIKGAAAAPSSSPPRFVLISSIGADNVLAQLAFPGGVLFW